MPGLGLITLIGLAVLVVLAVVFLKLRHSDQIGALVEKRRAGAQVTSRADYMEGAERIPVALSLVGDTLYYENPDLEASFELARVDEIEYTDELATGRSVPHGCSILRLRSHGAMFEFALEKADCVKWAAALPPRSYGSSAQAV